MNYGFSQQKLPRGFSFPLKRSALDAALAAAGITHIHVVYYITTARAEHRGPADRPVRAI
jgi:hypothetical protein